MNLSPDKRIAGVLAPLFALRTENDLGIGDLKALRQFIDWARDAGFGVVQILPINETGGDNSPYNAISATAIEPTTLYLAPGSPVELTAEDYESVVGKVNLPRLRTGAVNYPRVKKLKRALLEKAFRSFRDHPIPERREAFHKFCENEASALADYALFRALMHENGGSEAWDTWREEHQSPDAAQRWLGEQSARRREAFEEMEIFFCFVQWIAAEQWNGIRHYAEERGVALMGDIPFGVSYYSADVYTRRDEFALHWSGGAPPEPYFKDDEFTQKWGQNWGIPLYRWDEMRARNFDWWRERVAAVRRCFHIFRIDHVLGFYRIYAFPWRPQVNDEILPLSWDEMRARTGGRDPQFAPRDDHSWENAEANRREGEEYLRVVLEEADDAVVVGEDLGTVPNYVRPSLQSLGIAGFKIPQWETYPDGRVISGSDYQRVSVATFATHDHKPLRALWEEAFEKETATSGQALEDLTKMARFADLAPSLSQLAYASEFYPAILEALFRSESWLAIVMITDLLQRKDRFNIPGTAAESNWTRRMHTTVAQLSGSPTVKRQMRIVRKLLEKTGRIATD